jgi:hypothetical protein
MKKLGFALIPLFVLGLAFSAAAQNPPAQEAKPVTTLKDRSDTVKMTVSGDLILDYVWRSDTIVGFIDGTTITPIDPKSVNTFEGSAAVQINVELSNQVSAVLQVGKERVDNGTILPFLGSDQAASSEVVIREMRVDLKEFLTPALSLQLGIPTWTFDVRGHGNSFAFDMRHAQPITRNATGAHEEDTGATLAVRAGSQDELDPLGAVLTYNLEGLTFDFVILPMVVEGGAPSEDEAFYAADVWFPLNEIGKGSRIGGILGLSSWGLPPPAASGPGRHTNMFTLGGGAVLKEMVPGLELYGEVYFQFGGAGENGVGDEVDARGFAFQAGLQYTLENEIHPWVGFNITMVSGDHDSAGSGDDTASLFLGYDNINDLMIIEDMYFGLDWDANYFALKFSGGLALSVSGGTNNLTLDAIIGICQTMEDVAFVTGAEDALGTEFDVRMKWAITKQASLKAAIAFLVGSDILEQSMGGSANPDSDDNAMLYTLGADLMF